MKYKWVGEQGVGLTELVVEIYFKLNTVKWAKLYTALYPINTIALSQISGKYSAMLQLMCKDCCNINILHCL